MSDDIHAATDLVRVAPETVVFTLPELGHHDRSTIAGRYKFHPATEARAALHQQVRAAGEAVAVLFTDWLPTCREASLAQTAIQEAVMWANAALSIHGGDQ